jgi:hypothetical protein
MNKRAVKMTNADALFAIGADIVETVGMSANEPKAEFVSRP